MDTQQQFDSELQTYFLQIKHEIKQEHIEYLKKHPELKQILNDFASQVLLEKVLYYLLTIKSKPDDVYDYAKDYFSYFDQEKDQKKLKPLIVAGPSGVGKGTLLKKLFDSYPQFFQLSVSYTTRDPRQGETHGKEYLFVTKDEFQKEVQKQAFVEYCEVHGNYYGTHIGQLNDIMKQGKVCVLEIDVQGAEKVNTKLPNQCNYIFISAPSIQVLRERLLKRNTESEETINKRVNNASREIEKQHELKIFTELINDDLDRAYDKFIIYLKEFYPDTKW